MLLLPVILTILFCTVANVKFNATPPYTLPSPVKLPAKLVEFHPAPLAVTLELLMTTELLLCLLSEKLFPTTSPEMFLPSQVMLILLVPFVLTWHSVVKFPALATLPTALSAAAATTTLFDNPPNPSPPKSPLPADLLPTSPLPADSPPTNPLALTRPLAPFAAPFVAFAARLAAALLTRNPPFAALSPLALTSSAAATSSAASPSLLPPKLFDALFASCLLDSILASAFALFFARPVSKRFASSLCFAPLNASASFAPPFDLVFKRTFLRQLLALKLN